MPALNAKQQAKVARRLQSPDLQDVQAGLLSLRSTDPTQLSIEAQFNTQLPVIAAALPSIAPCLLQHALTEDAPCERRMECLQGLVGLTSCAPKAISKALDASQVLEFVSMLATVCTWTAVDPYPPETMAALLGSYLETSCSLLEADPSNIPACDAFFKRLLPHAPDVAHSHDAALRVALPVLQEVQDQFSPEPSSQDVDKVAGVMTTVASWDMHGHIAALLQSTTMTPDSEGMPCVDLNKCYSRMSCCLWLSQNIFRNLSSLSRYLSDEQTLMLVLSQRSLWSTASCSGWAVLEPHNQMKLLASCPSQGEQASRLLINGWMSLGMWRMDARCLGGVTGGSINADVLVRTIAGELARSVNAGQGKDDFTQTAPSEEAIEMWLHVLMCVQLGMQHPVASPQGVRLLLKAGLLKGVKHALKLFAKEETVRNDYNAIVCLLAVLAWYAERFPAVRAGIAAEHLAACRAGAQQGQPAGDSSCLEFLSLWAMLQPFLSTDGAQAEEDGCKQAGSAGMTGSEGAACTAEPAGPVDYSSLCADEFAALPAAQLRAVLQVPSLAVSMRKLQRLVGQQIQVLQAHMSAQTPALVTADGQPSASSSSSSSSLQPGAVSSSGVQSASDPQHKPSCTLGTKQQPTESAAAVAVPAAAAVPVAVSGSSSTAAAACGGAGSSCGSSGGAVLLSKAATCSKAQLECVNSSAAVQGPAAADSAGQLTHGSGGAGPTSSASSLHASAAAAAGCSTVPEEAAVPAGPGEAAAGSSGAGVGAGAVLPEGAAPAAGYEGPACVVCGAAQWKEGGKLQLCAGCASVRYCSSTCQKQHWRQGGHRAVCKQIQADAAAAAAVSTAGQAGCGL